MKRIALVLAGLALAAGCAGKPKLSPRPNDRSEYVQGFVDGYLSAHPDQPYARDVGADRPHTAYRRGWETGHNIGKKDERQRP